jgi:nicotinamide phosphoribosyltransferase
MRNNELSDNLLLDTDGYKFSHWLQYPAGTSYMFSYLESRGGKYGQTVQFGLQPILKRLAKGFTMKDVEEAALFAEAYGTPFNKKGWTDMYEAYGGAFPVIIKAAPEGCVIETSNALMTVESTDPKFFWVVSYLETMLMRVWYPITVATQSWTIKQIIRGYLNRTSDNPEAELPYKLNDFGSRGVSSHESAQIGGAAHLVNFQGSDTTAGVRYANFHYKHKMSGGSIPAAEHSTITIWGRENEAKAYHNMITQFGEKPGFYAVVSDSYDIYNAISNIWGGTLKEEVLAAQGTLVVRPDSGHPATVVLKCLQLLEEKFGAIYNKKGFKVINNVRVIQGDGINEDSIREILESAVSAGYSASNIAFGMGGALLQQVNRDTQRFAFKCSYAVVDGAGVDVYKDPVTDKGKRSKKGKLDLVRLTLTSTGNKYNTVAGTNTLGSVLFSVFENGIITKEYTLDDIRKRANET